MTNTDTNTGSATPSAYAVTFPTHRGTALVKIEELESSLSEEKGSEDLNAFLRGDPSPETTKQWARVLIKLAYVQKGTWGAMVFLKGAALALRHLCTEPMEKGRLPGLSLALRYLGWDPRKEEGGSHLEVHMTPPPSLPASLDKEEVWSYTFLWVRGVLRDLRKSTGMPEFPLSYVQAYTDKLANDAWEELTSPAKPGPHCPHQARLMAHLRVSLGIL